MGRFTSFYLDALRFLAALGVFISHCNSPWFSNIGLCPEALGHKLVIVFFVLSGYVIAYTTSFKEDNLKDFLINRFSRLYSVIIPALLFTYIIDSIGISSEPEYYIQFLNNGHYNLRFLLTLLNLQELWGLSSRVSSNGPFWSIAFEFWYYIIFGVYMFVNNKTIKWGIIFLLLLFTGYKIISLFPVWILGVIIFELNKRIKISTNISLPLAIISLVILVLYFFNVLSLPFPVLFKMGNAPMYFASDFINDYYLGLLIAVNIFLVGSIAGEINVNKKADSLMKSLAGVTFTLYLFHYPLIVYIGGNIPYDKTNIWQVLALMILVFLIIFLISVQIENKRKVWKGFFTKVIDYSFNKVYRLL